MRSRGLFTAFAVAFLTIHAFAQNYGQLMETKVKAALGRKAVKGYIFSTYPLDNFGLATAYDGKQGAANFICATWECIGVSDDTKVDALSDEDKLRLVVDGVQYATPGNGPSLNLTEDEKKSVSLSAVLPQLLKVIGITFDLSHSNDISTTLTTGPISIRILRRPAMMARIAGSNGNPGEKDASARGGLALVYSDIVASSMKIEIKIDPTTKADLDAKLSGALSGKTGSVIGTGSDVSFKVDNATKGDYSFTTTKPLILAVYIKKQPGPNVLGDQKGWNDWTDVDLGVANKVVTKSVEFGR